MSVTEQAVRAREAARVLARAPRAAKDAGLQAMADALDKAETAVLDANAVDVARAEDRRHQRGADRPAAAHPGPDRRHGAGPA